MKKRTFGWPTLSVLIITLVTANLSSSAPSWAAESAAIAPRFFDSSRPVIKRSENGGPSEIIYKYPIDAIRYANFMKMQMSRSKHKCTFHTDRQTFTIDDETTKKTLIIRSKEKTDKKENPQVTILMTELFPKNPYVFFAAARHYEKQKDWTRAHESYLAACRLKDGVGDNGKSGSSGPTTNIDAATDAYYQSMMGHYATALKEFDKAIADDPDFTVNYKNRALAYRKLNKIDLALADEKKVAELIKEKTGRHHQFNQNQKEEMLGFNASMHVHTQSYEQAIAEANQGLKINPKDLDCLLARAQAEVRMGKYKEAQTDYKQCLTLTKDTASIKEEADSAALLAGDGLPPYGDLSLISSKKERGYPAVKNGKIIPITIGEIAADHKNDLRVYTELCGAYRQKSDWKNCLAQLDIMGRIEPKNSHTIFERIEAAQALLNWPLAEKLATEYLNLLSSGKNSVISPTKIEYVYMIRGLARTAQKNYAAAIADQTIVIRLDPTSAQALRDRSANYGRTNKSDLASQDNSAAIKLGPPD